MKPKEKAEQLTNKFLLSTPITCDIEDAKKCALIAVDEMIEELIVTDFANRFPYWQQVKQEIEKL
jgi:hypothetical protein